MNVPDGQAIFHNLNQHHEYFCIWKGDTSLRYGEIILEKCNIAMMNYKDKLQQDISIMMIVWMIFSFDRMCSTHIAGSIPPTQFPGLKKKHNFFPKTYFHPQCLLEEDRFWCCTPGGGQDTGSFGTALSQILPVGLLLPFLSGTYPFHFLIIFYYKTE